MYLCCERAIDFNSFKFIFTAHKLFLQLILQTKVSQVKVDLKKTIAESNSEVLLFSGRAFSGSTDPIYSV